MKKWVTLLVTLITKFQMCLENIYVNACDPHFKVFSTTFYELSALTPSQIINLLNSFFKSSIKSN
jgi:hypothetical protein